MSDIPKFDASKLPEEIEVIDNDAVLPIQVSTGFYNRLQSLYFNFVEKLKPEDLKKIEEQLTNKKIEDAFVFDVETLIILLREFQKVAKEEGKIKMMTKEEYLAEDLKNNIQQ